MTNVIFIAIATIIFLWIVVPISLAIATRVLSDAFYTSKINYFKKLTELGGNYGEKEKHERQGEKQSRKEYESWKQ